MVDVSTLVPLAEVAHDRIEALLDRAFGEDRHTRTAYKVREGTNWLEELSFASVAEDGLLIGTIQAWPVALTGSDKIAHKILMVGPVAVLPERQDMGHGRALMTALARASDEEACPLPQMLIGDPEYYGRLGFSAEHTGGWRLPGPWEARRLLAKGAGLATLPQEGMLGPWRA